jgi:hypothetical protein
MPISRINPDGTVKIYNSKTKQVLDVKPEELSKYNPALENDYNVLQSLKAGNSQLTDIPAEKKVEYTGALQGSGITLPPIPSSKGVIGKNIVDELNNFDPKIKNSTGTKDAFVVLAKQAIPVIGGALIKGEKEAKYSELQGKYFALVQAALTATQGSKPSDYDVKSYMKNIGMGIDSSPEKNQAAMGTILTMLGQQPQEQPKTKSKYTIEEIK